MRRPTYDELLAENAKLKAWNADTKVALKAIEASSGGTNCPICNAPMYQNDKFHVHRVGCVIGRVLDRQCTRPWRTAPPRPALNDRLDLEQPEQPDLFFDKEAS